MKYFKKIATTMLPFAFKTKDLNNFMSIGNSNIKPPSLADSFSMKYLSRSSKPAGSLISPKTPNPKDAAKQWPMK